MATTRLAYGLVTALALLWVDGISMLIYKAATKILPGQGKHQGNKSILIFITSFIGSTFLLLLWFLCPFIAFELFFVICLVPFFSVSSGIFERLESLDLSGAITRTLSESAVVGALLVIFSIIREPLGFFSLSLPGGRQGIFTIFSFEGGTILPIHIIASSSGALLLLGYGLSLYRYMRKTNAPREEAL